MMYVHALFLQAFLDSFLLFFFKLDTSKAYYLAYAFVICKKKKRNDNEQSVQLMGITFMFAKLLNSRYIYVVIQVYDDDLCTHKYDTLIALHLL